MDGLVINEAKPEEAEWAAQLMTGTEPWITLGTTVEQCLKTFREPGYEIFAARINTLPVGFIIIHSRGLASSPYVKSVVVEKAHRGHRIGVNLMKFVERHFRNDSSHLFLCVSSFNTGAQKFYTGLGYTPVGVLEDYIIQGESEIIMHKRLQ